VTDTKTLVKNLYTEGRPLVEQALDIAEQFKAFRETARNQGVDWTEKNISRDDLGIPPELRRA
jgi:hypothetical protein